MLSLIAWRIGVKRRSVRSPLPPTCHSAQPHRESTHNGTRATDRSGPCACQLDLYSIITFIVSQVLVWADESLLLGIGRGVVLNSLPILAAMKAFVELGHKHDDALVLVLARPLEQGAQTDIHTIRHNHEHRPRRGYGLHDHRGTHGARKAAASRTHL